MEFLCPSCQASFAISLLSQNQKRPKSCPFCAGPLPPSSQKTYAPPHSFTASVYAPIQIVPGHTPVQEEIQFNIGPYQILKSIGKGGMGEVLLAYDTTCGRRIALKRVRADLTEYPQLHNRFLKEARITSQLTHPAIIPIYSIHEEKEGPYYTMPFVEGQTLKQILRAARHKEKMQQKGDHETSIPALVRIFLSICQAVAYAHSKGILHRDLKPENIIVGKYGETLILDWGLAKTFSDPSEEKQEERKRQAPSLTRFGKVVGTVAYMAPERAKGQPATAQTDIYSLGAILYQILTLKNAFKRGTLKEFRKDIDKESIIDPSQAAPYRDVPPILSSIALKCLAVSVQERYLTVDELIRDLEGYIEGRSEWFKIAELQYERKTDWAFQEHVLIAEHMAITRHAETVEWVHLMISKQSFPENAKIETQVRLGEKGQGIGFLLGVPEAGERTNLNDGYCLWLSSDLFKSTKALRSAVEVLHAPDIFLSRHEWHRIRIEKIENHIRFYLNDALQFSYTSYFPVVGTHIGLLSRDADFSLGPISVSIGSQSIRVNCLAVPDALLAHKNYDAALHEYRRIGYSFLGTAEGREALFRAGIVLLEKAHQYAGKQKEELYDQALEEFGKLQNTPGAPLEYLGKALAYEDLNEYEEEAKCFALAYRKYPGHPLLPVLQEQIVYRMHESARFHRKAAYHFILLAVRHFPETDSFPSVKKLFSNLQKHWESPYFLEETPSVASSEIKKQAFALRLAFWLAKPYGLQEIAENLRELSPFPLETFLNVLFCLAELGAENLAEKIASESDKKTSFLSSEAGKLFSLILQATPLVLISRFDAFFASVPPFLAKREMRVLFYLMEKALDYHQLEFLYLQEKRLESYEFSSDARLRLQSLLIWAYLLDKNWTQAEEILHRYPLELLNQEMTPLHFLYGCWLAATEGKEIAHIHFSGILETAFPRSWNVASRFLSSSEAKREEWFQKAFLWEKRQLYRQLSLYFHCVGDERQAAAYAELAKQERIFLDE